MNYFDKEMWRIQIQYLDSKMDFYEAKHCMLQLFRDMNDLDAVLAMLHGRKFKTRNLFPSYLDILPFIDSSQWNLQQFLF